MHFVLATAQARSSAGGGLIPATSDASSNGSFEFEFSARFDSPAPEIGASMSSADELFLNGQIRPMRLCAHLQRPQKLPSMTLLESEREDEEDDDDGDEKKSNVFQRSRLRNRSQRRRTRSLSPLRSTAPFEWYCSDDAVTTPKEERENEDGGGEKEKDGGAESEAPPSGSSSRCSSAGRSSKRWVFLKDFLRSKSEGRSNNKFWHNINISFSPAKEKREKGSGNGNGNVNASENANAAASCSEDRKAKKKEVPTAKGKAVPGGKRRSAHEMHYAANRAQAEEMRKKTFLPYRQGLLGCLGFNSKSYGAINGFARALNPVSSR